MPDINDLDMMDLLSSEFSTQAQPATRSAALSPIDQLRAEQERVRAAREAQASASRQLVAAQAQKPGMRFANDDRSAWESFKDPTSSQRSSMIMTGLALAASDPTKDLSQRIGQALGTGAQTLQKGRQDEMDRVTAQRKAELATATSGLEGAKEEFGFSKDIATLQRQEAADKSLADYRLEQIDIAQQKLEKDQLSARGKQQVRRGKLLERLDVLNQDPEANAVEIGRLTQQVNEITSNLNRITFDPETGTYSKPSVPGDTKIKKFQHNFRTALESKADLGIRSTSLVLSPVFDDVQGRWAQFKKNPVLMQGLPDDQRLVIHQRERISDALGAEKTDIFKPLSESEWPIARKMVEIPPGLPQEDVIQLMVKDNIPAGLKAIKNGWTREHGDAAGMGAQIAHASANAIMYLNGHGEDPENRYAGALTRTPKSFGGVSVASLNKFFPLADSSVKGQGYLLAPNGKLYTKEFAQAYVDRSNYENDTNRKLKDFLFEEY